MKRLLVLSLVFIVLFSCRSGNKTSTKSNEINNNSTKQKTTWDKSYGGVDKSYDTVLLKLRDEITPKFQTLEFKDSVTGKTMTYNLFIPKDYDKTKIYPLVQFIADASTVGKGTEAPLKQGYGGIIWATDESQSENPSFVLVPSFAGPDWAVNDNWETTDEVNMSFRLLNEIVRKNSVDKNRIYTTGQSMGGMISFYLNATHPDFFAASLFVGCQWDINVLQPLTKKAFFYIVSAGDGKASKGMQEVGNLLTENRVKYGSTEFSAQLTQAEQESKVQVLVKQNYKINFFRFTPKTVTPEGVSGGGAEHMYSFDYAYKLKGVRDWLFKQIKDGDDAKLNKSQSRGEGIEQFNSGIKYFKGNGVEQDYQKAKNYFLEAWKQGNMKAARYLGIIYEEGLSVDVDYTKALNYYKSSAKVGDMTSKGRVGLIYEKGLGVKKDYMEALKWYREDTSNKDEVLKNIHPRIISLFRLGYFYEKGLGGLDVDTKKALEYCNTV